MADKSKGKKEAKKPKSAVKKVKGAKLASQE